MDEKYKLAMDKAKMDFICKKDNKQRPASAFLSSIYFNLKQVWDTSIPTACINTECVKYNPDFFLEQNPEQRVGLMAHETWHIALQHGIRLGDRDPIVWNWAGDYVINTILLDAGFSLPEGGLVDKEGKYKGMSTEEVYDALMQEIEDGERDKPSEVPGSGQDILISDLSEEEREQLQNKLDKILMTAAVAAEMDGDPTPGRLPGDIARRLADLKNPKVPWNLLLQNYFASKAKDDYSMRRPNKRYLPDICMPSLYSDSLGKIAFITDASCSVSDEDFNTYFSEAAYVKSFMQPEEFYLVTFTTQIGSVNKYARHEIMDKPNLQGYGGTAIEPVFDWISKNEVDITVIFTDGGFYMPSNRPEMGDIIWIILGNPGWDSPVGQVIHYEH